MGKQKRRAARLDPSGSRVRPGGRRVLRALVHSGKLAALLLVGLTSWIVYDALTSPRYFVREVEAAGTQALTAAQIATLADVQDEPIWYVDTEEIESRVAQSPYVERVNARLVLPDRLRVEVTERKPEVRWMHDGTAYAVTWDGLVVDQAAPASAAATEPLSDTTAIAGSVPLSATGELTSSTPLTTTGGAASVPTPPPPDAASDGFVGAVTIYDTTPNRPLKVGDYVDADALELARRVILRAPTELPAPITRIEWDAGLGVSLIFGEARQVVLGKSNDLDRKLATLRFLLSDNTQFSYLDLRPTTPYYRP